MGAAILVLLLVLFLVATPLGRYLARAGWEEGKILAARKPIARLVNDPTVDSLTRRKLRLVTDARLFARDSLGLETSESFTTYSDIHRDTLVLVVSGAYRDQLKRYTWWFPIVGRVPYKGFFDFAAARREMESLVARGFDARMGPASAFSTLGYFNDPLVPSTLRSDSLSLANTVIHELTHNTFYARGGAVFNESFANFVGARGAERFFRSRGQEAAAEETIARWRDERVLGRFWATLYATVDSTFQAHPGDDAASVSARITLRDSIFAEARTRMVHELGPQLRTISIRSVERIRLDNAVLLSRRVYLTDLDAFDAVLQRDGGDLRRAVVDVIAAAKSNADDPFAAVRALGATGAASP